MVNRVHERRRDKAHRDSIYTLQLQRRGAVGQLFLVPCQPPIVASIGMDPSHEVDHGGRDRAGGKHSRDSILDCPMERRVRLAICGALDEDDGGNAEHSALRDAQASCGVVPPKPS